MKGITSAFSSLLYSQRQHIGEQAVLRRCQSSVFHLYRSYHLCRCRYSLSRLEYHDGVSRACRKMRCKVSRNPRSCLATHQQSPNSNTNKNRVSFHCSIIWYILHHMPLWRKYKYLVNSAFNQNPDLKRQTMPRIPIVTEPINRAHFINSGSLSNALKSSRYISFFVQ